MSDRMYCAICDEPLPDLEAVKWTVDPWGKVYDYAHKSCADDWEPSDEQLESYRRQSERRLTQPWRSGKRLPGG